MAPGQVFWRLLERLTQFFCSIVRWSLSPGWTPLPCRQKWLSHWPTSWDYWASGNFSNPLFLAAWDLHTSSSVQHLHGNSILHKPHLVGCKHKHKEITIKYCDLHFKMGWAHFTRWELCFHGEEKKYASCNSILKMSPSWAFHVGVWVGF